MGVQTAVRVIASSQKVEIIVSYQQDFAIRLQDEVISKIISAQVGNCQTVAIERCIQAAIRVAARNGKINACGGCITRDENLVIGLQGGGKAVVAAAEIDG